MHSVLEWTADIGPIIGPNSKSKKNFLRKFIHNRTYECISEVRSIIDQLENLELRDKELAELRQMRPAMLGTINAAITKGWFLYNIKTPLVIMQN